MSDLYRPDQPQRWLRQGPTYVPDGRHGFDRSHCHKPTPLRLDEHTIRVYFGTRDDRGRTRTTFVDVRADRPSEVVYVHDRPVLDLGRLGAFDDSGANVCSVLRVGGLIYMYFIGWNPSTTVHTRNAIGLAISEDGGWTFRRAYDGAVLDRSRDEPYYTGAVDVMQEADGFRVWYTSGSEWKLVDGKPEIFYHIKYGHSRDGIDWVREGVSCIPPAHEFEATARPSVIHDEGRYRMWYSRRDLRAFRTDPRQGYRAGYAESDDGLHWTRLDDRVGLDCAADPQAWDGQAVAYPAVLQVEGRQLLFYNGNGFGRTGFGHAERGFSAANAG